MKVRGHLILSTNEGGSETSCQNCLILKYVKIAFSHDFHNSMTTKRESLDFFF